MVITFVLGQAGMTMLIFVSWKPSCLADRDTVLGHTHGLMSKRGMGTERECCWSSGVLLSRFVFIQHARNANGIVAF
jgi:hypothetical protein